MSGGTKTTEKTSGTQQVQLPAWMSEAGQSLFNDASAAQKANPVTAYKKELVAGLDPNQTQAGTAAASQANAGQGDLNAARALTYGAASGTVGTVSPGMFDTAAAQQYASPFTAQVQARTLAEQDRQNKMELDSLGDNVGAGHAFGGTRHAVLEAETRKGQDANKQDYLAASNDQAYQDAAAKWQADRAARMSAETTNAGNQQSILDRLLAAAGQASGNSSQAAGLRSNSIMDLLRTGGVAQDTQTQQDQAAYDEFKRQQTAPLDQYSTLAGILSGTPRDVTTTSTGTSTKQQSGSLLNTLLGLGQIGASAFSERRVKRDIEIIGTLANGLGIYAFRYVWDRVTRHVGVMADEVARIMPTALGPRVFGIQTVNYGALREAI